MKHNFKAKFLFPMVSIGPFYGYKMNYLFPLERLTKHMPDSKSVLSIERKHYYNGEMYKNVKGVLEYNGEEWTNNTGASYECESIYSNSEAPKNIEYIETHIEMLSEGYFNNSIYFTPLAYALYFGNKNKTFLSDSQLKFGSLRTIDQISVFGQWVEGYPDCNVSFTKNIDESIIIINPYPAKAKIHLYLEGRNSYQKSYMIDSQKGVIINLSKVISEKDDNWSGQVIVKGKNRLILFFLKHRLDNFNSVTTLEHSENFRGEPTYYSFTNTLVKIQKKLLNILNK